MRINYRIGLDVGTNSLGWSILQLDENGAPNKICDAGVRIFSDGRDEQSNATLKSSRSEARAARRRRDRFKQRQLFLLDELTKAGLFPADETTRNALQKLNPLKLRADALPDNNIPAEKLPQHHVGRALFHLNQRRGFQSNRKDRSEEATNGKVSNSIRMLLQEMNLIAPPIEKVAKDDGKNLSKEDRKAAKEKSAQARKKEAENRRSAFQQLRDMPDISFGKFLWQRQQKGKPTRARPGAGEDGKLYDVYPSREMLKDEFAKIWQAQAKFYPRVMTDDIRKKIYTVIFTQRPLRPPIVGKCAYITGEDRTFRAMPSFQRYRIFQEVNNLEIITATKPKKLIDHPEARNAIIRLLENPNRKDGHITFAGMKKIIKEFEIMDGSFTFNFETPKRKGLDGNKTSHLMRGENCVGKQWDRWSTDKQDEFIDIILEQVSDDEVKKRLMKNYDLSEDATENCLNANFDDGTASLSLEAAKLLLDKMDNDLMIQSDAVQAVADENPNFNNPFTRACDGELQDRLPYYGEAFQDGRHIIPGTHDPEDKGDDLKYYGGVTNPTVHIALNQIRQVVNELISCYGHPKSIAIELGRNLPAGKEARSEIEKEQKKNQEINDRLDDDLRELGQRPNRDNRLRLRLWEELDNDPNGRLCPFSGDKICITDLFNGEVEIEHLIPFSRSLDDSRANKVLCTRKANRDKGNRTPFEAFSNSPDGYVWNEIFMRAQNLSKPKQWRFREDAMQIWERDNDFTARHLNDTRYIGRLAKEYLELICPFNKIDVLSGRLTALLRGHWGLNSILRDAAEQANVQSPKKKNRDDHRHHAVDAIVIGMTTRSMLQKVSTTARRAEKLQLENIFPKSNDRKSAIDPWDGFRNEARETVQNIIVSHKPKRKKIRYKETKDGRRIPLSTDGQLHNQTAYGIIASLNKKGVSKVVTRWPIEKFKTRKHIEDLNKDGTLKGGIRDTSLRKQFLDIFDESEENWKKGAESIVRFAQEKKIRHLRRTETLSVIPIKDKFDREYKSYQGDSNWGMEIYEYPRGHKKTGKWDGIVISRFDANQPNFQPGETYKPHPAARLVMRLKINDCVEIADDGKKRIMRLQKISEDLTFTEHFEANVDSRNRDKENPFKYYRKSLSTLKSADARKVHISPTGKVNYEIRRKPRRKS